MTTQKAFDLIKVITELDEEYTISVIRGNYEHIFCPCTKNFNYCISETGLERTQKPVSLKDLTRHLIQVKHDNYIDRQMHYFICHDCKTVYIVE